MCASKEIIRTVMAEVLDEGLEDWVIFAHIVYRASVEAAKGDIDGVAVTLGVVGRLVVHDLAQVGIIGDAGFEAWDLPPDQIHDRIVQEGVARRWKFGLDNIWLATTDKGDDLARRVRSDGVSVLDGFFDE